MINTIILLLICLTTAACGGSIGWQLQKVAAKTRIIEQIDDWAARTKDPAERAYLLTLRAQVVVL